MSSPAKHAPPVIPTNKYVLLPRRSTGGGVSVDNVWEKRDRHLLPRACRAEFPPVGWAGSRGPISNAHSSDNED